MAQLSPNIFLVVETTEFEGDPFLSLLIRMINKVIGFSCIRFTALFPVSNFNTNTSAMKCVTKRWSCLYNLFIILETEEHLALRTITQAFLSEMILPF